MINIASIEPGTKFNTTAILKTNSSGILFFDRFQASREHYYVYGIKDSSEILDVECEIVDNDLDIESILRDKSYDNNQIDYFCLARVEKDGFHIGLIYPNVKVFFMCFPYGCNAERFWNHDIHDINGDIEYKKGSRRSYMMRIKVKEINL